MATQLHLVHMQSGARRFPPPLPAEAVAPWNRGGISMSEGGDSAVTAPPGSFPAGFDRLPVLDLSIPDFTNESNRILKELRARGPLCRVEPVGYLGLLRWSDCDAVLRDFRSFSAAFPLGKPIPGAEAETTLTTLIREDPPKHTRVRSLVQQ